MWCKDPFGWSKPANTCIPMVENDKKRSQIIIILREPYMGLLYTWWKKFGFDYFEEISIVFYHASECPSMCLLVKKHNKHLMIKHISN